MVKIRLARRGRKKAPMYDVVIANITAPRDGRFIEKIGTYNPNVNPAVIDIDEDRAVYWLMEGAVPTDTVRAMLSYKGMLFKKHLLIGVQKGAITPEQAEERFGTWRKEKDAKVAAKIASINEKLSAEARAKLEAETKIKEARAEVLRQKAEEEEAKRKEEEAAKAAEEAAKAEAAKAAAEEMKKQKEEKRKQREEQKKQKAEQQEKKEG